MATLTRPQVVDEPGVWFGIATGLLIVTFLVSAAFGVGAVDTAAAAILVAGVAAVRLPVMLAPTLGLVAWAFYTGFAENDYGQLSFDHADLVRLACFVAATAVIAVAARRVLTGSGDQR